MSLNWVSRPCYYLAINLRLLRKQAAEKAGHAKRPAAKNRDGALFTTGR